MRGMLLGLSVVDPSKRFDQSLPLGFRECIRAYL